MSLEGVTWPRLYQGYNLAVMALLAELDRTMWLDADVIAAEQFKQLRLLAAHHMAHTPSFAARMMSAGLTASDLTSLDGLRRLPPLKRIDVQRLGDDFFSKHVPKTHGSVGETRTSGSTGEPVRIRKTQIDALFWTAHAIRDHMWSKRDFRHKLLSIRADIFKYNESSNWGQPIADIWQTGSAIGVPATFDMMKQLDIIKNYQPGILLIYPNNLNIILDEMERDGGDFSCIKHIKTIGETVWPHQRQRTQQLLGLKIEDNYSSNELGCMAMQCPDTDNYHVMSETVLVEILDAQDQPCQPGEIGRIVATDLHNHASPLIRYDIGDWAEAGGACGCGRGLPTIRRFIGREHSILTRPDGTRIWPIFYGAKMNDIAPVRQYQFRQKTVTSMEFRCFTETPLTDDQRAGLIALVQDALGYPYELDLIEYRQPLPTTARGKFQEFICEIG
jgi:phenylacetate-CoA ligase